MIEWLLLVWCRVMHKGTDKWNTKWGVLRRLPDDETLWECWCTACRRFRYVRFEEEN